MILSERWILMDIGKKIKELRVAKGLTQEELADRSELSKGFISQLERISPPRPLLTLMDILQCLAQPSQNFSEEPEDQIVFQNEDYFERKLILNLAARPNGLYRTLRKI